MDRRDILTGSMALPVLLVAAPAQAIGAPTLREQMLGSWKLIEPFTIDKATGAKSVWDNRPGPYTGMIAYLANGSMIVHIGSKRESSSKGWDEMTPAERLAAADSWYGYFGRFEVDEERHEVHHFVTGSLQPDEIGKELVRKMSIDGNKVTLTTVTAPEDKTYNQLTWERV